MWLHCRESRPVVIKICYYGGVRSNNPFQWASTLNFADDCLTMREIFVRCLFCINARRSSSLSDVAYSRLRINITKFMLSQFPRVHSFMPSVESFVALFCVCGHGRFMSAIGIVSNKLVQTEIFSFLKTISQKFIQDYFHCGLRHKPLR